VHLLLVLEQQAIEANWLDVILVLLEVARNKSDKRASTAVARFLAGRLGEVATRSDRHGQQSATERKSRAQMLLDELLQVRSESLRSSPDRSRPRWAGSSF